MVPGRLKVYVHHCSRADLMAMRPMPANMVEGSSRWLFDQADVVLTTYEQLTIETSKNSKGKAMRCNYRLMKHIKWHRVVLDESQRIQNGDALITQVNHAPYTVRHAP